MSATLIQQTIVPDDCFCTNTHKDNNLCYTYGEEGETSCRIYQKMIRKISSQKVFAPKKTEAT